MNIEENKLNILDKITSFIPIALGFLLPIFFLPTTTEFFELNKLALLIISTILLTVSWAIKIAFGSKIEITKSSLDAALIVYTIVFALSTIFSINKTISVFGSQGRWFPSLIAVTTFIFYFYTATAGLKDKKIAKMSLLSLIIGSSVSTFVAILGYFGIHLGNAPYLSIDSFNLAGSITTTSTLSALAFIMSISLLRLEQSLTTKITLAISAILNFFLVALVSTLTGWIVIVSGILGYIIFLGGSNRKEAADKTISFTLAGTLAAILLVVYLPTTSAIIKNPNYPKEIVLPAKESWIIASSTIQSYPILATGPSTFHLNFSRFRPLSMNNGDLWNVRFDKPFNEVFNTISNIGILGLAAGIYVIIQLFRILSNSRKVYDESGLLNVAAIGVLAVLPVFAFTYATILNVFVAVYLTSILIARNASSQSQIQAAEIISVNFTSITSVSTIGNASALKGNYINYMMALPFLGISAYAGYMFFRGYTADMYMRQALVATTENNGAKVYEYQQKALNIMPNRDLYHNAFARTNIALANAIASNQNLTDTDKTNIQNLISQAIRTTRVATEVINPLNPVSWETRADIYRSLINVANNADEWSINAYNAAIQLDPSNPALRLDLGGIYYNKEDYLTAANLFRQATTLKPNYANAHYNFAQALSKLNDVTNAIAELEVTRSLIAEGSEDHKKVSDEIASLKQLQDVAGAQDTRPKVEEISQDTNNKKVETQEPLVKAGEEEQINNTNLTPEVLPKEQQQGEDNKKQEGQNAN